MDPAQASGGGGFFGWGGGLALKARHDYTGLTLNYEQREKKSYWQMTTISGALEGFFNVIKKDSDAEKKYFTTLYLDDWDLKVVRHVKPVANWTQPGKEFMGDPIAFLSVQVGYPNVDGSFDWKGHVFQSTDTGDATTWTYDGARKNFLI